MTSARSRLAGISSMKLALAAQKMEPSLELLRAEPIAIVGMGCRFPGGALDPRRFWELLREGRDAIGPIPASRWDADYFYDADKDAPGKMYTRSGGFLSQVDGFDPAFFATTPREAMSLDPQQRLLLEVSWEALEDAGLPASHLQGSATGVFTGIGTSDYVWLQQGTEDFERIDAYHATGNSLSAAAGRLSYFLGLNGPSLAVDTACSSSLVAVHLACQSLRLREINLALAGGVSLILAPQNSIAFSRARMMAPDGRCKTFDAQADGYGRGEGCGIVVLKRLSDAVVAQDRILAVIRGSAVNQDGPSGGLTVPNGPAQQAVLRQALQNAGVEPGHVSYVEAHGTGTPLGDPIEVGALAAVYGEGHSNAEPLLIGSVKTNIGHLEAAAGIAGLIKVVLSLQEGQIPPHLHFQRPNPHLPWESLPVRVVADGQPWPAGFGRRLAGVSSFGFVGTNAHVIVEEAPPLEEQDESSEPPVHLLCLSAKSKEAVRELAGHYRDYLGSGRPIKLADLSYTAHAGRDHFSSRLAVVGAECKELGHRLEAHVRGEQVSGLWAGPAGAARGKVAFLFTGQGAQYVGMGQELYEHHPVFRETLERCEALFRPHLDRSLMDLLYGAQASEEMLAQTQYTQPVIFSIGYALAELWRSWGVVPELAAGHSIGEYAAACVAGVFSLEEAIPLVALRAQLMQALPPGGSMAAVLAGEEVVGPLLSSDVEIAAYNAPGSLTVSGKTRAVEQLCRHLEERGIGTTLLRVSHAFHSALMEPMLAPFQAAASRVQYAAPRLPLAANTTGQLAAKTEFGAAYWCRQLREPVRFGAGVQALAAAGAEIFVELGGRPVLGPLARHTLGHGLFVSSLRQSGNNWQDILSSAGQLYTHGVDLDWEGFHRPWKKRKVAAPTYPFERQRHWIAPSRQAAIPRQPEPSPLVNLPVALNMNMNMPPRDGLQNNAAEILDSLKEIIQQVSGIDAGALDVDADLFALGLDSLMLSETRQLFEKRFAVQIPLELFFQGATSLTSVAGLIARLAPAVEEAQLLPLSPQSEGTRAGENAVERVIALQLQSMRELMDRQLEMLRGGVDRERPSPVPEFAAKPKRAPLNFRFMKLDDDEGLAPGQREFIQQLIDRYTRKTAGSRAYSQKHRRHLADWVNSLSFRRILKEIAYPIVASRSEGARLWDVDGNEYIDIAMGYGVSYFGHRPDFVVEAIQAQLQEGFELAPQNDLAGEVASLVIEMTGTERVTFCNTGSEAVSTALRLARTVSGRLKVAIFAGAYHGNSEVILGVADADGVYPLAPGITQGMVNDLLVLNYGMPEALSTIRAHAGELAAVLVEPVQSRRPDLQPREFLHQLRALTQELGVALIFDEMITGFRIHPGGAQAHFGIHADLVVYGKIVGGGLPIGIVAGQSRYLDGIDGGWWQYGDDSVPSAQTTFFGGTFCKHPLTMASARAALQHLRDQGPALQQQVNLRMERLANTLDSFFAEAGVPMRVVHFGSQFRFESYGQYSSVLKPLELDLFFHLLMEQGVYTWERRICFLSTAHTDADVERIVAAVRESVQQMLAAGFWQGGKPLTPAAAFPMSSAQQRMYVLSQLEGGELSCHLSGGWLVEGQLDVERLKACGQHVVDRHESLRTGFELHEDQLIQRVHAQAAFALTRRSGREGEEAELLSAFIRPFALHQPPLVRAEVVELGPARHLLLMDTHHIALDGISLNVLFQELMALYQGAELPPPGVQYREYVRWQQGFLQSPDCAAQESYWLAKLGGELPRLELPLDFHRPKQTMFAGASYAARHPAEGIRELSRRLHASPYMVLLSVYGVLLHKLTGQDDLIVGTVTSGRHHGEFSRLLGMTATTLPLWLQPKGTVRFAEYLNQVKQVCLEAYARADYPFERLVEKLGVARDTGRQPLFDTLFTYEQADARVLRLGGLAISPCAPNKKACQFDLNLDIVEQEGVLCLNFEYRTDLFAPQTIARFARYFAEILDALVVDPQQTLGEIEMLPAEERHRLLAEFNDTRVDFPAASVLELFAAQVARCPEAVAVIGPEGELSYAELNRKANRLAHFLREQYDVDRGTFVGIHLEPSVWVPIALLGVLKAGGAYVPLDPAYPVERLRYMAADSGCRLVLSDATVPALWDCDVVEISRATSRRSADLQSTGAPEDLAYLLYTSGSTGKPKGCAISTGSLANYVQWADRHYFGERPIGNFALHTPLSFDLTVTSIFCPLTRGRSLRVFSSGLGPDEVLRQVFDPQTEVNAVKITPSHLLLARELGLQLTNVQVAILGGEAVLPEHVELLHQLNPRMEVYNEYGPTEATVGCAACRLEPGGRRILIGKPIANTRIAILNRDGGLAPIGVVGELYIGGAGLARGYHGNPALTAERFVTDPRWTSSRLYRSGDRGRWLPDGSLEYLGRADEQVKVRGYRIELGEVEQCLRVCPGVREAAVALRHLSGEAVLVAYVVAGENVDLDVVRRHLAAYLPSHMIPAHLTVLPALPLSANGKLDRRALPAPSIPVARAAAPEPLSLLETEVLKIWHEVMNREGIGIHDDFFSIGGHSLKAVQVVNRIHQRLGVDLGLSALFNAPTVAGLAKALAGRNKRSAEPVPKLPDQQDYELSHAQKRLWIIDQVRGASQQYNIAGALLLEGELGVSALERAIALVVERHESLRTTFALVYGTPRQRVGGAWAPILTRTDLSTEQDPDLAARAWIQQAAPKPFDLAQGPLVRAELLCLAADRHVLFFNAHHIIFDGWSMAVMFRELEAVYRAQLHAEPSPLPDLKLQCRDWAAWQNQAGGEAARRYWQTRLSGELPVLNLPTDRPRPPVQGGRGATSLMVLERATVAALQEQCRSQRVTLFIALLGAVTSWLWNWSGQDELIVGTPVAGRTHPELEQQIGCYINMLPLRSVLRPTDSLAEMLAQVRQGVTEAFEHQEYPFDRLVEDLGLTRDESRHPVFGAMLILHNTDHGVLGLEGLRVSKFADCRTGCKLDLNVEFQEDHDKGTLEILVEYDEALFTAQTMAKRAVELRQVLEILATDPAQTLEGLREQLLGAEGRQEQRDFDRSLQELSGDF